jgi:hypothetical protein
MLSTDRDEFTAQLSILCAGFDKPLGERIEAYWKGLAKMSIVEFARCVDYALGPDGPDKLPAVPQIWALKRKLRAVHLPAQVEGPSIQEQLCEWLGRKLGGKPLPKWFTSPWTYLYRDGQCTGVRIEREGDGPLQFSVLEMLSARGADTVAGAIAKARGT